MTSHARFLKSLNHSSTATPSPTSSKDEAEAVDSDFVVILAALLCALICVLGLVAVARCAWLRRFSGAGGGSAPAAANKGLKKKVLKSLPKVTYSTEQHAGRFADDCAICLSEFSVGEEIRVLPQCGHGFHVTCIDTWLGSHSSCPSCRQILAARCQKCGGGLPERATCAGDVSSFSGASSLPPPLQSPPVRSESDSFLP